MSTNGLSRLASKELNFFVTANNMLRAIDIVSSAPSVEIADDTQPVCDDQNYYELKFTDGDSCGVQRVDDGVMQTTVFFPEGVVVNSYPEKLILNLPRKDRIIKIQTYDKESDLFEEIIISKDHSKVFREITEQNIERI